MRRGAGPLGTETDSASPVLLLPGGQLLLRVNTFLEQPGPAPGRWLAYNLCKVYRAGRG